MDSVVIAAILICFCQVVTVFGAVLLIRRTLSAKQEEIEARAQRVFNEWCLPPKPGEPSKIMLVLGAAGNVVGAAAAQSIMASMSAAASQDARVANGVSSAIELQKNPLMGFLAGGKRGKGAAMKRLIELAGTLFQGGGAGPAGGSTGGNGQRSMSL